MKWEYKCVIEGDNYHLSKKLDRLGEKGWEAFSVVHKIYPNGEDVFFAYLKRRKRKQ